MRRTSIRTCAVIGAGNMGSGLAQKIATEGFPVLLVDQSDELVQRGLDRIRTTLEQGVERRIFRETQAQAILERICGTADWSALAEADLVIEAVFEDLAVKKQVFQRLGEVCKPDAILGTNTSSFYVKDLVEGVAHPERVLGLHYFYHPAKNRLVELIAHEGTDPGVFRTAWTAQEAFGKAAIRSADAPGFVVNRFFVPWLNESVRILEEGVANVATIEAAAKKAFGAGAGPFQLMNMTGVPITMHAANTLGGAIHPFYAPAQRLIEQVESGNDWDLEGDVDESRIETVANRLLGVVFFVVASLVDEGVASVEDTDIGARVGLRWPRGPFEILNRVGSRRAQALVQDVVGPWDLSVPAGLAKAPEEGVALRRVTNGPRGNLAQVWIERPASMNALDEETVAHFETALQSARESGAPGAVVGGSGKAFVAGADIKFFVDHLRADDFPTVHDFAAHGQRLFATFSGSRQPMVARVQGQALGGGAELALACDWIACSERATVAFPETGIGIFPGLGGTQRLPRRVGLPIAKYLIFTGRMVDARTALQIGLCDSVESFFELDASCESLVEQGPCPERTAPTAPRDPDWQPVWDFFSRYTVDQIVSGEADTGEDALLDKAVKRMQGASYHALCVAERLLDASAEVPLAEGLKLETAALEEVFCHEDGLEGLSALLERRRPAFQQPQLSA